MQSEVRGIQVLGEEELKKYVCDTKKPFVFMSYAHSDSDLVRTVYVALCKMGYNIWLDAVKLPHINRSWNETARQAILNPNCCCLLFFRSEDAVGSKPCAGELRTAVNRKIGELPVVSVDIWRKATSMRNYLDDISGDGEFEAEKVELCEEFADITRKEANAVRLREDCDNDLSRFVERIAGILRHEYDALGEAGSSVQVVPKPETVQSFQLDWGENASTLYDYFFGAFEQYGIDYDSEDEEEVFTGFSCACAIKKYHTDKGETYMVFVNDLCGDLVFDDCYSGRQVTAAYMCDDGSKAEEFIREFEAHENSFACLEGGDGYFIVYMENNMKNRFRLCAIKHEGENAEFCDDRNMFGKYLFTDDEERDIEQTLKRMSKYQIRTYANGDPMYYRYYGSRDRRRNDGGGTDKDRYRND